MIRKAEPITMWLPIMRAGNSANPRFASLWMTKMARAQIPEICVPTNQSAAISDNQPAQSKSTSRPPTNFYRRLGNRQSRPTRLDLTFDGALFTVAFFSLLPPNIPPSPQNTLVA